MSTKLFLLTLVMLIISACNTAEQKPVPEKSSASSSIGNINNAITFDQTVYFSIERNPISEASTTVSFVLSRTGTQLQDNQAVLIEISGTADNNDYDDSSVTVNSIPAALTGNIFIATFTGDSRNLIITADILDDTSYEPSENLHFSIIPNSGEYQIRAAESRHSIIISNDDIYPQATFDTSVDAGTEGLSVTVDVNLSNPSKSEIIVPLYIDQGSSTASVNDYSLSQTTLIFTPGDITKTVTIPIATDLFSENTETFLLKMGTPFNANMGAIPDVDISIIDGGVAASYAFTTTPAVSFDENSSTILTLTLTGTIDQEISIPYTILNTAGNPILNVDFTASSLFFVFPAGSTTGATSSITITGTDDALYEGSEVFTITVANTTYANASAPLLTTVTMNDFGESIPAINIPSSTYITQEGITFYLPIKLTYASSTETIISYTTAGTATVGTDHSLIASSTITIPAGVKDFQLPVFIFPDNVFDNNETINISLVSVDSGTATIDAANDDSVITLKEAGSLATVEFTSLTNSAIEGSNLSIGLTLSQSSQDPQIINLLLEEISSSTADYTALSTADPNCSVTGLQVTFNSGAMTCTLAMPFVAEGTPLDEPIEQFKLKIEQPNDLILGSKFQQIVNIIDNDPASEVFISFDNVDASLTPATDVVSENNTAKLIHFDLDNPSGFDLSINYTIEGTSTAIKDTDYTISSGTVLIPKGSTTASLTVNTINDLMYEMTDETVVIKLQSGGAYSVATQDTAELTITEASDKSLVSVKGATLATVNENDIVNVLFELDTIAAGDIVVNFDYDDSTTGGPYCGGLPANYKCAELTRDVQDLTTHSKQVTILAGTKQGVLSFQIDADNLYELIDKDRFRIRITTLVSTDFAIVDTANDFIDIAINDIDLPSVARFIGTKSITLSESNKLIKIPIYLSNPSEAAVNIHAAIVQTTDVAFNLPDENDFIDSADDANASTTYDNDGNKWGNLAANQLFLPGTSVHSPTRTNSPLTYTGGIIYEGRFNIPAYSNYGEFVIEINDDVLYEGNEKFNVVISSDTTDTTYGYSVNSLHNEFEVTIIESKSTPTIKLTAEDSLTNPIAIGADIDEDSGTPTTPGVIASDVLGSFLYTDIVYTFEQTPISQHDDVSFEVDFSGDSEYIESVASNNDYMLYDYHLDLSNTGTTTDFIVANNTNGFNLSLPAAFATTTDSFTLKVHRDYKYEPDEEVIVAFSNLVNTNLGTPASHSFNIINDDAVPFISFVDVTTTTATIQEYEFDQTITVEVTSADKLFKGKHITEIPVTLDYNITSQLRHSTGTSVVDNSLALNESNDYTDEIDIDFEGIGDFRRFKEIDMFTSNLTESAYLTSEAYYDSVTDNRYEFNILLEVPDLVVAVSKGSEGIEEGSKLSIYGHTCTAFRGEVSCVGRNNYGQLAREDVADYGDQSGEDISDQQNTVNLGTDEDGRPLYAVQLVLGTQHSCALFSDYKSIKCWGRNNFGQLGLGLPDTATLGVSPSTAPRNYGFVDTGSTEIIKEIKSMHWNTCALFNDGELKCWGRNTEGELGIESDTATVGITEAQMGTNLVAVKVPTNVKLFTTGGNHGCVVTDNTNTDTLLNNKIYCWGMNTHGQLGLNITDATWGKAGTTITSDSTLINNISNITKITSGTYHTCVNFNSSTFSTRCWGNNEYAQLGLGRVTKVKSYTSSQYGSSSILTTSNRVDYLGINQSNYNQPLYSSGHFETWLSQGDEGGSHNNIDFKDYADSVDLDVTNNQFAQVYYPASDLAAGFNYTCGVYSRYLYDDGIPAVAPTPTYLDKKYIRCWGSNIIYNTWKDYNLSHATLDKSADIGILYNTGSYKWYNGFNNGEWNIPHTANASITNTNTSTIPYNNEQHLRALVVGSSANSASGDGYHNAYDARFSLTSLFSSSYSWGYVSNMFDSGLTLNFELNYKFSEHARDFTAYDDIELVGGESHICALQKYTTPSNDEEANNELFCWGANWGGQSNAEVQPSCNTQSVGGAWACGAGRGNSLTFNYTY